MIWIVKLGGSLFDVPGLTEKLCVLTKSLEGNDFWIVPGGGNFVEEIRRLAGVHSWSEETSHQLAIRAMSLTAHVLAASSPDWEVIQGIPEPSSSKQKRFLILDVTTLPEIESLPETWSLTSDSIAAWIAARFGSGKLLLGKSTNLPDASCDWTGLASRGLVDPLFPEYARGLIQIEWVNLRLCSLSQGSMR